MGCPKSFSVKGGMGAALLDKPEAGDGGGPGRELTGLVVLHHQFISIHLIHVSFFFLLLPSSS